LAALEANMAAWNRWCAAIVSDSGRRLHPVAHLTLRDSEWVESQLAELEAAGVHLAMVAPAPVDGRPLSHPDHERIWAAFVEHGVSPVFHVADQPRVFDDCWYPAEGDSFVPAIESAFIWVPPALALTDLILNGVFDRHPGLRIGIVELSSIWVPQFLLMLDGSLDFTSRLNGTDVTLAKRPSDYLLENVRIASFSYEDPARLTRKTGDVYMFCSDYPHSEGTDSPLDDYRRADCDPAEQHGLFGRNIELLLNH
jgi:predicted TIM-barrel fold metal-dependent hydrolase